MVEIPDGMTDEEFHEFYWSKTDDERIEINRQLAHLAREQGALTDEEFAESEAKFERHAEVVALKKKANELLHKVKTALELVENRLDARVSDMAETESPDSFDGNKNKKSH